MKKLLTLGFAFLLLMNAGAQSDKYVKAMEKLLPGVDTLWDAEGLKSLSNSFERIAEAEKTQWLPYYYAALTRVNAGYSVMMSGTPVTTAVLDPVADKAEELLNKAEALSPDNSEIFIVKKLIATLRLVGDPMARAMTYGPIAAEALAKAKTLDPNNPRVALQEGMDKINTPEQWGGSVTEGKKILEDAVKKYEVFKPQSSIHPNWGLRTAQYFLNR